MKGVIIMLMGLLLMPGAGTARAAAGDFVSGSIAVPAEHAEPLLDGHLGDTTLFPDTYLDPGVNGDEEMLASQPLTVWDYVIDPQVTINLEYRPFATETNDFEIINDGVDLEQITQNFMLGVHYKF